MPESLKDFQARVVSRAVTKAVYEVEIDGRVGSAIDALRLIEAEVKERIYKEGQR